MPEKYYCIANDLATTTWTPEQIHNITGSHEDPCQLFDYDYSEFKNITFEEAQKIVLSKKNKIPLNSIECSSNPANKYYFVQDEGISIVPEWNLVCENKGWRSTVQVALSIGKFLGASIFGVIGDRYGRKTSYCMGALLYIVAGILTSFSPWYWLFMVGRILLGAAGAAIFYSSYTICIYVLYLISIQRFY